MGYDFEKIEVTYQFKYVQTLVNPLESHFFSLYRLWVMFFLAAFQSVAAGLLFALLAFLFTRNHLGNHLSQI